MQEAWDNGRCKCCGSNSHSKQNCSKRFETCNICDKKGHLAKVCYYNDGSYSNNERADSRNGRQEDRQRGGRWRGNSRGQSEERPAS